MCDYENTDTALINNGCGNRRSFLIRLMRSGAAVLSAGTLLRAVSYGQEKQPRILATTNIADNPNLEKVGGYVLVKKSPAGELLIIRSSESEFTSLSTVCPHKHCKVRVLNPTLIRCPCHKSTYKIDGTYIHGPANASLKKFVTRVEAGVITTLED
jgi:Rieske Fe-S protein